MANIEIGAFDAKARLSELLRDVQQGGRYTITVRGKPVAELVPCKPARDPESVRRAVDALLAFPKITGVTHEEVRAAIAEGRK